MSHASLNKLPNVSPKFVRDLNYLLTDLRYLLSQVRTRQQAVAIRELYQTPLMELERKWGIGRYSNGGKDESES